MDDTQIDTALDDLQKRLRSMDETALLEPSFQAICVRLFGLTDIGSDREQEDETFALADPRLQAALAAVAEAIEYVDAPAMSRDAYDQLTEILRPIRPDCVGS